MASNSVGQVTVEIVADASNFEKDLSKSVNKATKAAEPEAEAGGKGIGAALSKGVGGLLKTSGLAIGALFSASLVKGFGRLNAIDQAEQKLLGLGNSAEEVVGIMDQALKSVEGTAFGLGEAATLSAAFMAAGVSAGEDLSKALDLTVDAASLAGTGLADMGDIMVDVAAAGKLTGDELNRMADRGIDALGILTKHYGITREEAQKMVSEGEISFEEFAAAMEANIGNASTTSGATFVGAMANIGAALGRFGAQILKPFFEGIKSVMPSVIAAINGLTAAFKPIMDDVGPAVAKAFEVIKRALDSIDWKAVGELVVGMAEAIVAGVRLVIAVIKDWINSMQPGLTNVLTAVGNAIRNIPWDVIIGAIERVTPLVIAAVAAFMTFNKVKKVFTALTAVVTTVQGAIIGLTWATKGHSAVMHANTTAVKVNTIGLKLHGAATKIAGAATKVFGIVTGVLTGKITLQTVATQIATVAQKAFNKAMAANPIGLIIAGVMALIAALTLFFTKTEVGRAMWEAFTTFLVDTWNAFMEYFGPVLARLQEVFTQVWETMVTVVTEIWNAFMGWIVPIIEVFVQLWKAQWELVKNIIEVVWNLITTIVIPIVKGIFDFIRQATQAFVDFWGPIWNVVKGIVQTVWNVIKGIIDLAVAIILGIFTGDFSQVVPIIQGIWEDVKAGVESAWDGIIAWIREVPQKIMDIFSSARSWLKDAGANILHGLWDGLKSVWTGIESWFTSKVDGLVAKAESLLKIGSPSKVFEEIGRFVGEGFVNGLESMAKDIEGTANLFATPAQALTGPGGQAIVGPRAPTPAPAAPAGAQNTFASGAIQVNGSGDPYKAALLTVNKIAERVSI